jgi:hypothetical protein
MPSRAEKKKARSGPPKTKTRPSDDRPSSGPGRTSRRTSPDENAARVVLPDEPPRLPHSGRSQQSPCDELLSPRAEPEAPAYVLVILPAQDIRLPEVLRHIEAGRIVLVIPAPNPRLAADRGSPTPGIKAKPEQDRS